MSKERVKAKHRYGDPKAQKLVNRAIKAIKVVAYILALAVAGYGAWWFTIPGGGIIGVVLILAGILISAFATFELKVRESE